MTGAASMTRMGVHFPWRKRSRNVTAKARMYALADAHAQQRRQPHSHAAPVGNTMIGQDRASETAVTNGVSPAPRRANERARFRLSNREYTATKRSRTGTTAATAAHRAGSASLWNR